MRSTKDLVEIVNDVRSKSRQNGRQQHPSSPSKSNNAIDILARSYKTPSNLKSSTIAIKDLLSSSKDERANSVEEEKP